ncbi:MAG: cytochrome c biogenesis protein ResB [Opitutaceae bacterium]
MSPPQPRGAPQPSLLHAFRDFFASLRLTVVLLALGIILVFWATLSQADLGVWGVQQKFFHSLFVLQAIPGTRLLLPIFPGGYLLGGFLLANLLTAHYCRFRWTWRKSGIWLTHAGLILLIVGEFASGLTQHDYDMTLSDGQTRNYAESQRGNELAIIDETDPKTDTVVSIPESAIAAGDPIQSPLLPFRVVTRAYFPNVDVAMRNQLPEGMPDPATAGIGTQIGLVPQPTTSKENERNLPGAYVELDAPEGSLGTFLVSSLLPLSGAPFLEQPQRFTYAGHRWEIVMRIKRRYLPFSVTLLKFSHDIYPGTTIARNFSSRIRLTKPDGSLNREVLIYMNNPLRYDGLTFYQASFANQDRTSILEVVRNPSWRLPYIACAMIALGLVIQFGLHLAGFARRRRAAALKPAAA